MTAVPPSAPEPDGPDLRVIFETPVREFAPWLAMVLIVTWAGFPGVACVTPVAWLLALRVGILCVQRSTSTRAASRLREAALAGGVLGLLQGMLFWAVLSRLGPVQPGEETSAAVLTLLMIVVGALCGAALSAFTAYLTERRREADS